MCKSAQNKPSQPVPIELAAAENLAPFFFRTLSRLGLEIVVVRFDASKDSPIFEHGGAALAEKLEQDLQANQAGQFDSSYFTLGAHYHFFHVARADLGRAMQALKRYLEARGLLEITTLLHAESPTELREWFPGEMAELIEVSEEVTA